MGPSSQQNAQYGKLTSASDFATGTGEGDLTASSTFMRGLLSGDATKISQTLAPQISAAKTAAQQQNKTSAEMGTRSGGTAASTAATSDKVHSDITSLVAQLTGGAASGLSSEGSSLLGTGIAGTQTAFGDAGTLQKARAAKFNDIISSSAAVAGAAFGAMPAGAGSFADVGGNFLSGMS